MGIFAKSFKKYRYIYYVSQTEQRQNKNAQKMPESGHLMYAG